MAVNFLGQIPYLLCCVLSSGDCVSNQMFQNARVEAENIACSCIQNDDLQYAGKMKTKLSGEASLHLRKRARTVEHTSSYLIRVVDTGVRNPFGSTQAEPPKDSGSGSSTVDPKSGKIPSTLLQIAEDEPPLARWPVQAYLVKGVLIAGHDAVAIVEPPEEIIDTPTNPDDGAYGGEENFSSMDGSGLENSREQYVIKVGERLGSNDGTIVSISLKGLAVLEGTNKVVLPVTR